MQKVLIVHAHPEPSSVTSQLTEIASETLSAQGHEVMRSDLYGMGWKAVFDGRDFPVRAVPACHTVLRARNLRFARCSAKLRVSMRGQAMTGQHPPTAAANS